MSRGYNKVAAFSSMPTTVPTSLRKTMLPLTGQEPQ